MAINNKSKKRIKNKSTLGTYLTSLPHTHLQHTPAGALTHMMRNSCRASSRRQLARIAHSSPVRPHLWAANLLFRLSPLTAPFVLSPACYIIPRRIVFSLTFLPHGLRRATLLVGVRWLRCPCCGPKVNACVPNLRVREARRGRREEVGGDSRGMDLETGSVIEVGGTAMGEGRKMWVVLGVGGVVCWCYDDWRGIGRL